MAIVPSRVEAAVDGKVMRGREHVWCAVTSLLGTGRSGVLLVDGEAGTGKSLLLAVTARAAAERGYSTLVGEGREFGPPTCFEPLLSALGGCDGEGPVRWAHERPWIVERLGSALAERAGAGPVMVGLDDLQWADPAALRAIQTLSRRLAAVRVVWLLTRRTTDHATDAGRLFDRLERDGAVRFTIGPLDAAAVRQVATDVLGGVPDADVLRLAGEAGGDPALLTELLSGLLAEGAVRIVDGHARLVAVRLPGRVEDDVRRRLDTIGPATRQLLSVGAIIGRSFAPEDVAELLGTTPAALLPWIDEAFSRGLLVAGPDELCFRNDLVWRVTALTVPAPVRRALHRQIGDLLLGRGRTAALPAASHLIRGIRAGDARALTALDRAVAEVIPASPRAAAALATHALRLTDPREPAWPARALTAIHVLTAVGRLEEAAELVDSLFTRPLPHASYLRLHCLRAELLYLRGRAAEAAAEATAVLGRQGVPRELRDDAELVLLDALAGAGDDAGARAHADRIVSAAAGHGDVLITGALIRLALSDWGAGRLTDGLGLAREAVRRARSAEARRLHPRMILAMLLTDVRRLDEARAVMGTAGEDAETTGNLAWAAAPGVIRARLDLAAGRFHEAVAEAEAALASTRDLGPHLLTSSALAVLVAATLRAGDLSAAWRYAEAERPALSQYGSPRAEAGFHLVRAQVAAARAGPASAEEAVVRLCDEATANSWTLVGEPTAAPWLVRTALALGDRAHAERVVSAMDRLAADHPVFDSVGVTATHARGLFDRDRAALRRAAEEYADPWARASAAEDLGSLLAADGPGTRGEAIAGLDAALAAYSALGAIRDAARVRRRLRRLGIRRRHWSRADRPVSGWASLTDTERRVAELVAQGLTNREVADQLFMSAHTVAFHLRHIFRKLDVTSRVQLTRLAVEVGD
ncbi:LuxR C-terminal-related transcriptional regulator [Actinoallomurus sp. NPDC050550]|uniref:LuxR C-terminal-related transcriptional regulator n=1 Tax=Actinoallomurus sp. NPDC050550 TaxID=3154937 RepID=UPI0033F71683